MPGLKQRTPGKIQVGKMAEQKKLFTAKQAAKVFGVSEQTIYRMINEELVVPCQQESGSKNLFDEDGMDRIRTILALSRDLGVNWAGVEVILHMRERMIELHRQANEIFNYLHKRMGETITQVKTQPSTKELPKVQVIKILYEDDEE